MAKIVRRSKEEGSLWLKSSFRSAQKISAEEKRRFEETAKAVGLTPSAAIRGFVRKFCECKGMPFELERESRINLNHPNLVKAKIKDGTVIVPDSWRDDDDE